MPLYICHFCNFTNINKSNYYCHLHLHKTIENLNSFTEEDIKLSQFYNDKLFQNKKKYHENNKDKRTEYMKEYMKEYRKKNREKITEYVLCVIQKGTL